MFGEIPDREPTPQSVPSPASRPAAAAYAHTRATPAERVLQRAPALLHHLSKDGYVMQVSDRWLNAFGYERAEIIGRHIGEFMTAESADYARRRLAQLANAGDCDDIPFDFVTANGEVRAMTVALNAERDVNDEVVGLLLAVQPALLGETADAGSVVLPVNTDHTPSDADDRLFEERCLNVALMDNMSDALIRTDADGQVVQINSAAERILGTVNANVQSLPVADILPLADPANGEKVNPLDQATRPWITTCLDVLLDGREISADVRTVRIQNPDGECTGHVILLSDVSETRKLRDTICFQAEHDALTGLCNRHEFSRRLKRLIEQIHDEQDRHVLCFLDIDQFSLINDTCGHAAGDELLKQFGDLLSHGIRGDDTLARIGNDQYTLLLRGCSTFHAQRRTRALLDRLDAFRFQWEAKRFRITVSIGLVPIDIRSTSAESALRAAESACASARAAGRNRFVVFDAQDDRYCRHFGDLKWMRRVESALEENRFVLFAQPIRPIDGEGSADNHEILLRMVDRDGENVPPGRFLPAVERFNLSTAVDRWVVRHALEAIADADHDSNNERFWTINLSGQSLSDRVFQDFLFAQLNKNRIRAGKVCFEITETAAIAQMDRAIEFMNALREKGCALALDDFGSGLSSYAYLKNLPVDIVKIDGQFVRDIAHSDVAQAMVRSINEIAQLMGKRTVAEYVEDDVILERLKSVGVNYVQGYGIGHPRPMAELIGDA
jgi:diguanylate cyclase (GGDEF)-like protein/PAS domain S-box-containing protein